jgi:hypothetical protein
MVKWREFEQLAAKISAQLAPESKVFHDKQLTDQTGEPRQFDVIIEVPTPFKPLIVALECKLYSRSIGVDKVEAFHTKLQDCKVNQGIMISPTGFSRGGKKKAALHNIMLLSHRQADTTDWQKLVGPTSWMRLVQEEFRPEKIIVKTTGGESLGIREEAAIHDPHGEQFLSAIALAQQLVHQHPFLSGAKEDTLPRVPGPMWLGGGIRHSEGLFHILRHGEKIEFDQVVVNGRFRAIAHTVNLAFGEGDLIDDALNGESIYREMSSLPFRVQEIIREQAGVDLTPEEFELSKRSAILIPPEAAAEDAQMRISFTFKPS